MLLDADAVETNLATMAAFCREVGVDLAPHAKTSLSPYLVQRHLAHGAWAMTAALPRQVQGLHALGVPRILLANQLVDADAIAWIADGLVGARDREFWCYVDSVAGIDLLESALAAGDAGRPLSVLLEIGYGGGRTGVRDLAEAERIARRVARSEWLRLEGVAGFEGLIGGDGDGVPDGVDRFLEALRSATIRLHGEGLFESERPVVTAGGSSYFDRVVELLAPGAFDFAVRTVLRAGCYAIHDHGLYARTSPWGERRAEGRSLIPALELHASVLSVPEPGLAIVGFGRREVPVDDVLPVLLGRAGDGADHADRWSDRAVVAAVNDHHAYLRGDVTGLAPGDVLRFGVSHPCGAFDRWREILLVGGAGQGADRLLTDLADSDDPTDSGDLGRRPPPTPLA
jgi:D-serine deaminase-like pyridoxal phosphate-dependent protein